MAVRWDVDDRPQTLYTRVYVEGMWLTRVASVRSGD